MAGSMAWKSGPGRARAAGFASVATAAGLLLAGCGGASPRASAPKLRPATRGVLTPSARPRTDVIPPGPGALVAIVLRRTSLRAAPDGRRLATIDTHTEFASPEYLWVVAYRHGWLAVVSPLAGNGHVGWIAETAVRLARNPWKLEVSLSARRLTVLRDGRVIQRVRVAIGPPQTPTPTGRFAVTDRLVTGNSNGPYGCCILALSAHAPHVIQGWGGGDRIAIHSTPDNASIGEAVSHGCVRVTLAEGRWLLAHIPLATPTLVSG